MTDINLIALLLVVGHSVAHGQRDQLACDQAQADSNLVDAVYTCGIEVVKSMIQNDNVDVNQYFMRRKELESNSTALHAASRLADDAIVRMLLQMGAQVNVKDNTGATPLHYAAMSARDSIVSALLLNRAEVNVKDDDGYTPLHYGALFNHYLNVRNMLLAGALVNVKTDSKPGLFRGYTALHFAALRGSIRIVPLLIQLGADLSLRTDNDETALILAYYGGHIEIRFLLTLPVVNVKGNTNNFLFTPLHNAALKGFESVVTELLLKGGDVNARSKNGITPLHCAAFKGYDSIIRKLLQRGADINATDDEGASALQYAALFDHDATVTELLRHGAHGDHANYKGMTALHYAATYGHASVVSELLRKGARVTVKDKRGYTPLHYAAVYGHAIVISQLLRSGADVNAKNMFGDTPLHLAISSGLHPIVSLLIENGAKVNIRNEYSYTPLHYAITYLDWERRDPNDLEDGYYRCVRALVLADALVNLRTSSNPALVDRWTGWTTLHFAAEMGSTIIVKLLLQYGADRSLLTDNGDTALMLAERRGWTDVEDALKMPLLG